MSASDAATTSGTSYETLTERAYDFVVRSGGTVHEELLIRHVFGVDASPALWRELLSSILASDTRLRPRPGGMWQVAERRDPGEFPAEFVVLDVETTGLKARHHRITEVAVVMVSPDREPATWATLVNPERRVPRQVAKLTGIDDQLVVHAPRFQSIAPTLVELIGDRLIVGHNVDFDIAFVNAELARVGLPKLVNQSLDTLALADVLLPDLRRLSLEAVSSRLGLSLARAHRAAPDAETTLAVLSELRAIAEGDGKASLDDLAELAASRRPRRRNGRPVVGRGRSVLDRSHLDGIPNRPGVYIMRDVNDRVIYVGKARDLRKRVSSYYSQPLGYTRKMDGLLESIERIEVEVVGSELEALVLESQLIRRYRPRFNSQQRNAEQYVYIRVDTSNPWPTVTLTKDRGSDDARYFGPFKSARHARDAVTLINDILPLRTCRRSFRDARSLGSPCIEYSLHRCAGPCIGKADADLYRGWIRDVLAFLSGDDQRLLPVIHQRLEQAARNQDYERASRLRDNIRRLERISLEQAQLDEVAAAGHVLIVLPGTDDGSRRVWYLVKGQRWAELDIMRGEAAEDVASRLRTIRERALAHEHRVLSNHHSVDEMALISRWMRRDPDHPALISWRDGLSEQEVARRTLTVDLSVPFGDGEGTAAIEADIPETREMSS